MTAAPIFGLVLAGGRSSRMNRDKASLAYHGLSQLERTMALLEPFCDERYVSVRPDQINDPLRARYAQIVDQDTDLGPLAGILAAQARIPTVAWLVVACDLPRLDADTVQQLIQQRAHDRLATAFKSSTDGLPEPLCAIYEPASAPALAAYAAGGGRCPRKFLLNHNVALFELARRHALDNVNSGAEYWQTMDQLAPESSQQPRSVRVQYFAILREQSGLREEQLETSARNPAELYDELRARHRFTLDRASLRVAVNEEFGSWEQPLVKGDSVVFIPPVAGG
ncbi:MAG: NTP transferase domain-containing protein [Steroidobacteraceae bacterium]